MAGKGRSCMQPSEWDSHDDYNDSVFDPQYLDESVSGGVNLDHCRLYIKNIPRGLNEEGLRAAFSKFGTLVELYLSKDPLKKYGLVKFDTQESAKLAMMQMNRTEPLKLNINIAHKTNNKKDDKTRHVVHHDRSNNTCRDKCESRQNYRDDSVSVVSKSRPTGLMRTPDTIYDTINGENVDTILGDDRGFSDILDPRLTLELENLKLEQLKLKEEQLQCKHRMLILRQHDRRPPVQNTMSNRCVLPDGKIVVQQNNRATDLDYSQCAAAGDSSMPRLQLAPSRVCVYCSVPAEMYCARCELTPYCSVKCQTMDWNKRHRAVCHNLARLAYDEDGVTPVAELHRRIQNPAPLRRPHGIVEPKERLLHRDDENSTMGNDGARSERSRHLSNRSIQHNQPDIGRSYKDNSGRSSNGQQSPKQHNARSSNYQQRSSKPKRSDTLDDNKAQLVKQPEPKQEVKPVSAEKSVVKTDQVNGLVKRQADIKLAKVDHATPSKQNETVNSRANGAVDNQTVSRPASLKDVTPSKKVEPEKVQGNDAVKKETDMKPASARVVSNKIIPKNYLIELLSSGDTVLLSVDAKASECKSTHGDYVCLSMHEKYETDYQRLCEDYVLVCDADNNQFQMCPGEVCSYFDPEDCGWYRARCLNPTTLALFDSSKLTTVKPTDKIRKLPSEYEQVPEFSCVLECNNVEIGANLKCSIISKTGAGYKVSIESVESGSAFGEGILSRWQPAIEYPAAKPVIAEVPRPALTNNSRVVFVDATSLGRAFVRPAGLNNQREYDNVLQNVLLQGRKASPLTEPPSKGQTVIAKYVDGLHYRALCKRINVAQNKYLLEYIDFGNIEICRNLENMFPCPANLDISAIPTQVSMIKLAAEDGELTPKALDYVDKLKDSNDEIILTLPNEIKTAESGSEALLKLDKNNEQINKKIISLCTPDWKKFQDNGGDVVQMEPLMYSELVYEDLPAGPVVLDVLDVSSLSTGVISGCTKGNKNMDFVFKKLTNKMDEYCNSELGKEPYLPKAEELCIAQCPPYPQWFRAVLLEHIGGAGGANVRVCYVDYGNVEVVPVNLLRKILPEFVNGIPALATHMDIKDFPKDPSPEMLARAVQHMNLNDEGRGELTVSRCIKQDVGLFVIEVPALIKSMLDK